MLLMPPQQLQPPLEPPGCPSHGRSRVVFRAIAGSGSPSPRGRRRAAAPLGRAAPKRLPQSNARGRERRTGPWRRPPDSEATGHLPEDSSAATAEVHPGQSVAAVREFQPVPPARSSTPLAKWAAPRPSPSSAPSSRARQALFTACRPASPSPRRCFSSPPWPASACARRRQAPKRLLRRPARKCLLIWCGRGLHARTSGRSSIEPGPQPRSAGRGRSG